MKYEKRYKYPHMAPLDVAIWERFIDQNPDFFDEVDYDVAVGSKPEFDTVVNSETGGDTLRLYQKKIDVVGHKGGNVWIIEVKPNAALTALGQVLSYTTLYKKFVNSTADITTAILTDRIVIDMPLLAEELNVKILIA